jgi:hypothetical protein
MNGRREVRSRQTLASAVVLALAIAAAGWWIGGGLVAIRTGDRSVTVKGLSEQDVRADLAIWPLRFVATGNDLAVAQAKLSGDAGTVRAFLIEAGLEPGEIELRSLEVTDLLAQAYRSGPVDSRFIVAQTLVARSTDVDRVASASQRVGALVDAGVVLGGQNSGAQGPYYLFTRINDVKAAMIADATQKARETAQQFADDADSSIAGIRRAQQGVFQILPRDTAPGFQEETQIEKTLRVVTTIDYALDD